MAGSRAGRGEAQCQACIGHLEKQALAEQGFELLARQHPTEREVQPGYERQGRRQLRQAADDARQRGRYGKRGKLA